MFLLVRDEDVPTVAAAIRAHAEEEGLEPALTDELSQNPLAMLAMLGAPRAIVSAKGDLVSVFGLESLDLAEPEEWASVLSAACETEAIALELSDDGVRIHVYDGGEADLQLEVPLDPSGRTRAPEAAELTDDEAGKRELAAGVPATTVDALAAGILRCFGVTTAGDDAEMLAFHDPAAGEEEPGLDVTVLPAAALAGEVGAELEAPYESIFAITLRGAEPLEGVRLRLSGDALALCRVEALEITFRRRAAHAHETRALSPGPLPDGGLEVTLAEAYLEPPAAPALDFSDMFSAVQRLMSAGEAQTLNTVHIGVRAVGVRAGEAPLVLTASSIAREDAAGEASIPVRVTESR